MNTTVKADRTSLPGRIVAVLGEELQATCRRHTPTQTALREKVKASGGHVWADGSLTFDHEENWAAFVRSLEPWGVSEEV